VPFYVAGLVAYLARPANRAAWLLLLTATVLAIGKSLGAAISLASITRPEVAHEWAAVVVLQAAAWAVLAAGVTLRDLSGWKVPASIRAPLGALAANRIRTRATARTGRLCPDRHQSVRLGGARRRQPPLR